MDRIRKIVVGVVAAAVVAASTVVLGFFGRSEGEARVSIVTTNFPGYDFARAVVEGVEGVEVEMLLKPGAEMHDFEPTPQDIINIQKSDLFIYVGGESESWVEGILAAADLSKTKVVRLMDMVETIPEDVEDGEEDEEDEHVWTSVENAMVIVEKLKNEMVGIDFGNKESYEKNAESYVRELKEIDAEFRSLVAGAKRKEIVFGDRFPVKYFAEEYGLSYFAAFPGCAEQTEVSAKTLAFLIEKVREDGIPVVFKIELSSGKVAEAISAETGAKVLEFNSAHNISREDFENGITYAEIMRKNLEVLREALN